MSKLVLFNLGPGSLQNGFPAVTIQFWLNRNEMPIQFRCSLPPNPDLGRSYLGWKALYTALYNRFDWKTRIIFPQERDPTHVSDQDFQEICLKLYQLINKWLDTRYFLKVEHSLRLAVQQNDELQIIMALL